MPTNKAKLSSPRNASDTTAYHGKQTRTGNSLGFRFEGALFRSHPEFNGQVTARVIAPGHLLVSAETKKRDECDPIMASFLAFLAHDIAQSPQTIQELDATLADRMDRLTRGMTVSPNEDLGGGDLL